MLLGTLGAYLLQYLLAGKGTIRVGEGAITTNWEQGTVRAGQDF